MLRSLVLLLCVVVAVNANVVAIERCDGALSDDSICTITEVRVDPCKNPKRCLLQKGKTATIAVDYTPNFAASTLKNDVSYRDIAFKEMNTEGCSLTTCPTVPGKPSTLNYDLLLSTKLPNGIYPVQWKFWDESNDKNVCCFKMVLKLK